MFKEFNINSIDIRVIIIFLDVKKIIIEIEKRIKERPKNS